MKKGEPPTIAKREIHPGVWLDADLALYVAGEETLVIADLHWGYAESFRKRGNLFPMWGDEQISLRLLRLIKRYQPRRMVWLGDSLHTVSARKSAEEFLENLRGVHTIVLAGNHDRRWERAKESHFQMGNYFLHHGDGAPSFPPGATIIEGHLHPAVSWSDGAGLRLKLPVLVEEGPRWILPAFSPWTKGVAWSSHNGSSEKLWAISPGRIWPWRPT